MPIVVLIMPLMGRVSRNSGLYFSLPMLRSRKFAIFTLFICGEFIFTHAAQFALHVICTSPANRVC
jgi:hypothetical protein